MPEVPGQTGVIAAISAESIYADSLVTIRMTCAADFSACLSGVIVRLLKGRVEENQRIRSVEDHGTFAIEVEMWDWFEERRVNEADGQEAFNSYGMRFYPLISSSLRGNLELQSQSLDLVTLQLPDAFRVIWHTATVLDTIGNQAYIVHAYGRDQSKYIFRWRRIGDWVISCTLRVPVRLSGAALEKLVHFPIYYWLLSLFAIALASTAQPVGILLAAVGGVWTFMLQQWNAANLPQRHTILTHAYLLAGTLTAIWAAYWWLFGMRAAVLSVPIGLGVLMVFRWIEFFKHRGELPSRPARYWANLVKRRLLDERRKSVEELE